MSKTRGKTSNNANATSALYHLNAAIFQDREEDKALQAHVEEVFKIAGVEIGEEQLGLVISDFSRIFKCCDTKQERVERIKFLSQYAPFKYPDDWNPVV